MRILVVATEPLEDEEVEHVISLDENASPDVFVVAPSIVDSALDYWVSDTDNAQEHARMVEDETVSRLREAGANADGHAGDIDPTVAVDDWLELFDPDRVLVFKHPEEDEAYRENELLDSLREKVDVEIELRDIPASRSGDE